MLNTTLCYVTRGSQVLMLHRVKKKVDINKDKWIGIGGKFEGEESPDECLLREAKEETGLTLTSWQCRGVVTFLNDTCEGEYMYLFTADGFEGKMTQCDEGDLHDRVKKPFLSSEVRPWGAWPSLPCLFWALWIVQAIMYWVALRRNLLTAWRRKMAPSAISDARYIIA